MDEHDLKCWPRPFQALNDGTKTFEYRFNDRGFEVGDILHLKEWDPDVGEGGQYTGRDLRMVITHILRGGNFGVPRRYVVMSVKPL